MADRWGNFYSSYSPIFDSKGEVAGIIGVDFSSEWFEAQVRGHTLSIGVISTLTVVIGALVMVLITGKVRRKFAELEEGLSRLEENVDKLSAEIISNPGYRDSGETPAAPPDRDGEPGDEMEALSIKIGAMQHELERFIDHLHTQAYTDPLTHVGNTNAYQEEVRTINEQIKNGKADWENDYAKELMSGVDTFRVYVDGWYDGKFQDVIYYPKKDHKIKRYISSVLAGYAWDKSNPFVKDAKRHLDTLAELCK
jgi:hypothetical protein